MHVQKIRHFGLPEFIFFITLHQISAASAATNAVVAQLVEHQLPKLRVTSSSLAYRSTMKEIGVTLNLASNRFLFFNKKILCSIKKFISGEEKLSATLQDPDLFCFSAMTNAVSTMKTTPILSVRIPRSSISSGSRTPDSMPS